MQLDSFRFSLQICLILRQLMICVYDPVDTNTGCVYNLGVLDHLDIPRQLENGLLQVVYGFLGCLTAIVA